MADVTIVASQQVQTVAPAGGQQAQGSSQPSLPQGTLVSGTIAGKDASGNYLLKSPQGTFTLQSSTPLTYNSDVTIRIGANAAGATSARIVTVNGEPFSQFTAPEPETSDSVSSALITQAPAASTSSAPAAPALRAVVVSAPPPAPAAPALAQGSPVVVRLATSDSGVSTQQGQQGAPAPETPDAAPAASATVVAQPQQTAQTPVVPAAQPALPPQPQATTLAAAPTAAAQVETQLAPAQAVSQAPQATTQQQAPQQGAPAPEPQTPSAPAPSAPVSALYNVYAKQSTANPAPAAAPSAPAPSASSQTATSIPAQIVSADETGAIALSTPFGNVTVQAQALPALSAFSPGTNVTIELPPALPALTTQPASLTELAASWQSLKDIISVVNNASPTAASALLSRLPQIGADFTSSSTGFITTLLQNDARKLLGDDTIDTLRASGRQDLVERFSGELASLSNAFTSPQPKQVAGWQMLFLPFVYQESLQQARLYVKREPQKKERAGGKTATDTRFVVEVDLSELGPLQMDGLVRKKEQATAFDLVIRSHYPFPPSAQAEISGIYAGAAQLTGFKGSLAFQVTRNFAVKPLEEAGEETREITA